MKLKGYRVLPNSLRSANVHKRAQKMLPKRLKSTITATNADEPSLEDKIDKLFSGQDLLFERLHTEPKWHRTKKVYQSGLIGAKRTGTYVRRQPLVVKAIAIVFVSLLAGGLFQIRQGGKPASVSEVAGVTDNVESSSIAYKDAKTDVKPSFDMLLPKGKTTDQISFALVSPEGNAPVYAFIDQIGSTKIKISEQELPEQFKSNPDAELERVAKSFQATDIIQIDEIKVYHGLSDKTKVQSLVFVKNRRLIFIASPDKLTDDTWAGYILNLQ